MDRQDVVIEVRDVHKAFHVPDQRRDSIREWVTHPGRRSGRTLQALDGVSFDVRRGEFFGIVGRNGSGKSTLLKVLASIYRVDAGRVRVAGRLAPFIELGVGFNPELPARENVVLNGVLMGLSRKEAVRRVDAVLDFAELHEFADLKLKNYSSGMMVRLAFSVMVQADADILLVDEVLAVGDAAFSQRCAEVFEERRRTGRTVVLVTHDMSAVQRLCHRAMLLEGGQVRYDGDPEDAAMRYFRVNAAGRDAESPTVPDFLVTVDAAELRGGRELAPGTPLDLEVRLRARRPMATALLRVEVRRDDHVVALSFARRIAGPLAEGQVLTLTGSVENPLGAGAYHVDLWVRREDEEGAPLAAQGLRLLDFRVAGEAAGLVTAHADVEARVE